MREGQPCCQNGQLAGQQVISKENVILCLDIEQTSKTARTTTSEIYHPSKIDALFETGTNHMW